VQVATAADAVEEDDRDKEIARIVKIATARRKTPPQMAPIAVRLKLQ
jgi:hypothetical protein